MKKIKKREGSILVLAVMVTIILSANSYKINKERPIVDEVSLALFDAEDGEMQINDDDDLVFQLVEKCSGG